MAEHHYSWFYQTDPSILVAILFAGMITFMKLGTVAGGKRRVTKEDMDSPGNSTIMAGLFGLYAFLLGFTFSMSGSRYDNRRQSFVKEANAIGTAILRADLFQAEERATFRKDFKTYTQARIDFVTAVERSAMLKARQQAQVAGKLLWLRASANARANGTAFPANLMIPAMNDMLDSATSLEYAEKFRVPDSIGIMLFVLCLVSAFFIGYYSSKRGRFDWIIATGFCILSSLVIYITLDLDRPRAGLIQMDIGREAITELIHQFDNP